MSFNCLADAVRTYNVKGYKICWKKTKIDCQNVVVMKNQIGEEMTIIDDGSNIKINYI